MFKYLSLSQLFIWKGLGSKGFMEAEWAETISSKIFFALVSLFELFQTIFESQPKNSI